MEQTTVQALILSLPSLCFHSTAQKNVAKTRKSQQSCGSVMSFISAETSMLFILILRWTFQPLTEDVSCKPGRLYKEAVKDAAFSWYSIYLTEHNPLQRMRAVTSMSPWKVVAIPFDAIQNEWTRRNCCHLFRRKLSAGSDTFLNPNSLRSTIC